MRDAIRCEGEVARLQLGDARGEQHLEIGSLHLHRRRGALLGLVFARRLAHAGAGAQCRHEATALEERLRQVGVERVRVRLVEQLANGLTARTLVDVRVGAIEPQLRQHVRTRIGELRVGDVALCGGESDLVALSNTKLHSLIEREANGVRGASARGAGAEHANGVRAGLGREGAADEKKGEHDKRSRPPHGEAAKVMHHENIRFPARDRWRP